jgi:uncharacterized repeat protein (TIGR02543 family)
MSFVEVNCYGQYCRFGVQWNESNAAGTCAITPVVYRFDYNSTQDNSAWTEKLLYEPNGSTGSWNLSGYGTQPSTAQSWRVIDTFQARTYNKAHAAQTVKIRIITADGFGTYISGEGFHYIGANTYDLALTIPAKTSYTVSYNANGGSGAPSSQTKWHGETLTLSNSTPTRTGYTFAGWNTKSDGTGTNYAKGASFTANANTTLYAKWTLNSWTVSYNANGGSGSVSSQTKYYGQALTLASSGFTKTYYTLDGWATSATGGIAYALGASYTGNGALALYAHWAVNAPDAPTSVSASRASDSQASVSWTRATGADTTYERIYVERSTDGNAWTELGYVAGTATSYTDSTIAPNHSYKYRVRAWNSTAYSSYGESGTIYTTPAAPASVTGERTGSGTSILLTVGNDNTRTATGFDVESRAVDSDTWASVTPSSSTGTPVETITLDNMGGSFYFRVRNKRSTLVSAWTESDLVVTITPPNAPTLTYPSSGAVVSAASTTQSVTFQWHHNPLDGSTQTAVELRYRKSTTSSWTTTTTTTAQQKAVTLDEGYTYVWQVRTKGADANYGPWSNTQSFNLYNPPTVSITQPSGTVIGMPLAYTVSYLDKYGNFASGTIAIKLDGATLYSESLPMTATTIGTASPISGQVTTNEFLPSSGKTYTLEVSVRSSDTLTASTSISMPVNMGEPYHGTLDISDDPATGYASLTVGWDTSTGSVAATYATVYRVTDEGRLLMGDNLQPGAGILDKYAPLNVQYHYEIITHAESTAISVDTFQNTIVTPRWFAYWDGHVAWGHYGPQGSWTIKRPQKVRVHYVGRKYPNSYDGTAVDEDYNMSYSAIAVDGSRWFDSWEQLMLDGGRGIFKTRDGKVFHADFDLTVTPDYRAKQIGVGQFEISVHRIDGDAL